MYVSPSEACHSNGATASDSDIVRFSSSASVSHTVVPSSTLPARTRTPERSSSASASVVLPLPLWPTMATLRILSVDGLFNRTPKVLEQLARADRSDPPRPAGTGARRARFVPEQPWCDRYP